MGLAFHLKTKGKSQIIKIIKIWKINYNWVTSYEENNNIF